LCNDETKKEYLPKIYDPFLSGLYRGKVNFFFSPSIINEISIKNYIEMLWINKIYLILLISNYQEFEPKMGFFLNLINEFVTKSSFNLKRLFPIVIEKNHKEEKMDEEINKKINT